MSSLNPAKNVQDHFNSEFIRTTIVSSSVYCVALPMRVSIYLLKANTRLSCKTENLMRRTVD